MAAGKLIAARRNEYRIRRWKLRGVVRSRRPKVRRIGSQVQFEFSRYLKHRSRPVFEARAPRSGRVRALPGHTHPLGQTLIVTSGLGWAQQEGGPIEEIRQG